MKKAVNYLRGSVRAEVVCEYPERFINLCAQNGIEFWDLEKTKSGVMRVFVHISGFARLREAAKKAGMQVKAAKKEGVPFFLWRIRKRYLLLAGMLLCFLAVRTMSLFIWEIEVSGNEKVPAEVILETVREMGIGIGTFGPTVFSEAIANDVILKIPELSWFAINVRGSHAEILVRERIPRPEIIDENEPTEAYAEKTGIIVRMSILAGEEKLKIGDTVEAGDVLVSGELESLSSGRRQVHAMAEVYARTWYEKTCCMPLEASGKEYTGRSRKRLSVIIADKKINFFINSGIRFMNYDKITKEERLRLPTGNILPVIFITERFDEYTRIKKAVDTQTAEEILRGELLSGLNAEVGDGEIVSTSYEAVVRDGVLYVTLHAECIEEIAGHRRLTND